MAKVMREVRARMKAEMCILMSRCGENVGLWKVTLGREVLIVCEMVACDVMPYIAI